MLINFKNIRFSYGGNLIFRDVDFAVNEGEKVALVGANGEGKTTLIKLITGALTPDYGFVTAKNGITVGLLEQSGGLDSDNTVYEEMRTVFAQDFAAVERLQTLSAALASCSADSREYGVVSAKLEAAQKYVAARDSYNVDVKIRRVLNGMGFEKFYDHVVSAMSGGEKARLALALIAWKKPNLLVLDEPTNHLDMETREALTMALSTFEGAVLLVSHDRHLLRAVADKLWLVHEGRVEPYEGDLDDYAELVLEHRRTTFAEERAERQAKKEAPAVNKKEARRELALERQRIAELRRPLKKELERVERELARENEKLKALAERLADPAFYAESDPEAVAKTTREHGELAPKVEALEMRWLELSEQIESIG